MAVIGIDLGTTYCAASQYVNGAPVTISLDGSPTFPSVASVLTNGTVAVGKKAKNNQAKCPQDTVVEVKRKMGTKERITLGQKTFMPQEISAMFLKEIKRLAEEELGEEVTGAVITCPAYFKDPARMATKEAGQLAGLNVLNIINEPTAAAVGYGIAQNASEEENLFLVYDLGGGTFDVTVISMIAGQLEVIGTGGDPNLGGGDFDDRIVDWMLGKIKKTMPEYYESLDELKMKTLRIRLKSHAETAKIALCGPPLEKYTFKIATFDRFEGKPLAFGEELTMVEFESMITDLLQNSMKWIDVAMEVPKSSKYNYSEDNITEILLVGGSTRVPLVRKMLSERFPGKPLKGTESGINPDEIVAIGAGRIASELDPDNYEVVSSGLVDVTGHTLSVEALGQDNKPELVPIIVKETAIPVEASHTFRSLGNGQSQVKIKVWQGEGKFPTDNEELALMIGEYILEIDPIREPTPLLIALDIDKNGILVASAKNLINGNVVSCKINYNDSSQMTPEELKKKMAALDATMNSEVGSTSNPLDGNAPGTRKPVPPSGKVPDFDNREQSPKAAQSGSPDYEMNPIVKSLYDKAINKFGSIPMDKQKLVMQIIGEMQRAAQAGDQAKLFELYGPLNQLVGNL